MPTIAQLPTTPLVNPADEVLLSQAGVTRSATISTLLAGTQAALTVATGSVLGRTSLGAGSPEPLALGSGLSAAAGTLAANGTDHAGFASKVTLAPGDEVILNSGGLPLRMPVTQLQSIFKAGANITIDSNGVIATTAPSSSPSSIGPAGPAGPAGLTGPAGASGAPGASGPVGPTGPAGPPGSAGIAGLSGSAGSTGATGPTGTAGPPGTTGPTGPQGSTGPAWVPPKRNVAGTTDTPTIADDQGIIAYGSTQPTAVTVNDLGALLVYDTVQFGTGTVTLTAGSGVTLMAQGKVVTSLLSAYQGAALSVLCTGTGTVFVVGNSQ